jgi:hypothetical protein
MQAPLIDWWHWCSTDPNSLRCRSSSSARDKQMIIVLEVEEGQL